MACQGMQVSKTKRTQIIRKGLVDFYGTHFTILEWDGWLISKAKVQNDKTGEISYVTIDVD